MALSAAEYIRAPVPALCSSGFAGYRSQSGSLSTNDQKSSHTHLSQYGEETVVACMPYLCRSIS